MIDPRRLTDADKGRQVKFSDGSGEFTGYLQRWTESVVTVVCDHCGCTVDPSPQDISLQDGWQDG